MMLHRFFTMAFFTVLSSFTVASAVETEKAQWSAVMAGKVLCDPVLHGDRLYTVTSDQALNCIDGKGSFVWRRNIKRTRRPLLTASQGGVLLIADSAGLVQAVSSQGLYLWSARVAKAALYAPYSTVGGRICVLTQSQLCCFSLRGTLKWKLSLPSPPAMQLCETGDASLLLSLKNKDLLIISPAGEIVHKKKLKQSIAALAVAPRGYVAGAKDGSLTYYQKSQKSEMNSETNDDPYGTVVWEAHEQVPLFMRSMGNELICVYANGTVSVRDVHTNTLRWSVHLAGRIGLPLYCAKVDGEYYITGKGMAVILSAQGTIKRQEKVQKAAFPPLITPRGILVAVDDWVVNSWTVDTKIMRYMTQPQESGAALHEQGTVHKSVLSHKAVYVLFAPYGDAAAALAFISAAITEGTAGKHEGDYAHMLHIILTNKARSDYFPTDFTVHERIQAAELIGQLESLEYRTSLVEAAHETSDPTLAVAIIRALGAIACDPDGVSIKTIQLLLHRCGSLEIAPIYAACDSLTEIAKYGDKQTTENAVRSLFAIASHAVVENVKQYARQKIKTIVE